MKDDETSEILARESAALSLVVIGEGFVTTHALPETGRVVLGRSGGCDIEVDVSSISRQHAALHIGETLRVEDLGSSNGTRVHGVALEPNKPMELAPNDVIEVGSVMAIVQKRAVAGRPRRIWSHGYFEGRLEDECARAARSGAGFAVVRLRIERQESQQIVATHLRPGDVLAAYGPRDLEVLLVDIDPAEAEAIVARVSAHSPMKSGIACFPRDGQTAETLMAVACDRALKREPSSVVVEHGVMERLYRLSERVAKGKINVLLLGETGVGKEVLAERIHRLSPRASKPLVRISCAAFPENLLESELFGHERGAFTGADRAKPGLIESAHGGTVFLDEIGELPLALQPKLLRVLEERSVLRLGSLEPRPIDVRFIAATNRDLEAEVARERFRADLYFRLTGVTLVIPPLRERRSEIPTLARAFVAQAMSELGKDRGDISDEALELLTRYAWPGNLRELRNVAERAALLCGDDPITAEHLPLEKMHATLAQSNLRAGVHEYERARIVEALERCDGNQTRAAKLLGISRMTLSARMDAFGLPRPRKR
ncbi:MAG TPA: sigma 54-interacting transcriptional regulator [Polyangiaceae bacterium]|nr:sigma 54-interacting transcriptional regulator [Polyangiaceae bacterium]